MEILYNFNTKTSITFYIYIVTPFSLKYCKAIRYTVESGEETTLTNFVNCHLLTAKYLIYLTITNLKVSNILFDRC